MMTKERQEHHNKIKKQLFCQVINYKKEQEKMKPDHSITKGYPYDIIISKDRFKHRLDPILDRSKGDRIMLTVNPEVYPEFTGIRWFHRLFAGWLIDFLMFRVFDYAEALLVAETQIEHLLKEEPFLPEDFGFIKIVGPKEISDNPVKIYSSKYNEKISLFRNLEQDCEWVLIEKGEDSAFKQTMLQLPNHRIAYAAFTALSVKIEEINNNQKINIMSEKKEVVLKEFKAVYNNPQIAREETITLKAEDKNDAITKAKFIFETEEKFYLPAVCEFHHITITEEEGSTSEAKEEAPEKIADIVVETSEEDLPADLGGNDAEAKINAEAQANDTNSAPNAPENKDVISID